MQQTPSETRAASIQPSVQQRSSDPRIASKLSKDCIWASGLLLALWLLYVFVFYEVLPNTGENYVGLALAISGGLVLLFNSASIIAMIKHYSEDREYIYGLDLHYLDIMRKTKR